MKIEVKDTQIVSREGMGKNGRPYSLHRQNATMTTSREVRVITLPVEKDKPYPVGIYQLDLDESITVSQFGELNLRVKLKPLLANRAA